MGMYLSVHGKREEITFKAEGKVSVSAKYDAYPVVTMELEGKHDIQQVALFLSVDELVKLKAAVSQAIAETEAKTIELNALRLKLSEEND